MQPIVGDPRDEEVEAGEPAESRMLDGGREAIGGDRGEEGEARRPPLPKRRQRLPRICVSVAPLLGPSFRVDWRET